MDASQRRRDDQRLFDPAPPRRRVHRLLGALALAAALAGGALAPLRTLSATAAQPTFLKTLAGASQAAMYPSGLVWDAHSNRLVLADTGYNRISVMQADGTIILQFGSLGSADGQFNTPRQVAVDSASNIYVADAANSRIQAFSATGSHLWTAGGLGKCKSCLNTPIGITYDFANNVVLVADTGHSTIKAYSPAGVWLWTSPTTSGLASPRDAVRGPDGRIWVADYHHDQVKAFNVTAAGVWNTTPAIVLGDGASAGHGPGQLNFPYNVQFSTDGRTVYVADTGNERIARWDLTTTPPTWLPQFGSRCPKSCPAPPDNVQYFNALRRVSVDASGNIWAADFWGSSVHEFTSAGQAIFEIAGGAVPAPGFAQAFGVAVASDGTTYGVDRLNQRVERFDASGNYLNDRGMRGVAPGTFSWPEDAAVAPDGTLWVADTRNDRLEHFSADLSGTPAIVGGTGTAVGQFHYIEGVTVDAGGTVWVADSANNRVESYNPTTKAFVAYGSLGSGSGQFNNPEAVAVSSSDLYVADTHNNRVEELTLAGQWVASFSTGLNQPQGVTLAPDGTLWVADSGNNRIVHLSSTLTDLGNGFGSAGTGSLNFNAPHSLAVHGSVLFVADTFNNRIQEFTLH
jgi:sugar lactone lactonase YvrE